MVRYLVVLLIFIWSQIAISCKSQIQYIERQENHHMAWQWSATGDNCNVIYNNKTYYPERYREVSDGIREFELKKGWWVSEESLLISVNCYLFDNLNNY